MIEIAVPLALGCLAQVAESVEDIIGNERRAVRVLDDAIETIGGSQTWRQDFSFDRYGNRTFVEANTTTLPKNCGTSPNFVVCTADIPKYNPTVSGSTN